MLRRILIIALVVVLIIAAIFAIRWFLNRDSGTEESTDDTTAVVDESADAPIVEENSDTSGEAPAAEDTGAADQPAAGEQEPGSYPAPGDAAPADETAAAAEGGDAAPADETATAAEGSDTATADDTAAAAEGGDAAVEGSTDATDPNAGGGVPTESGAAAPAEGDDTATATGDAVAVEPATGGIGGVAAVSPAAVFNVQAGIAVTHTVQNAEWLTQLARCYGTTVADIQAANNYSCPDLIQPGWVVNIANPGNAGPITINEAPCFYYHTVQQGETLYSIATQYGISYQWLARINAIYNYNYIYAGQQLVIPNPVDAVFTQPPAEPFYYSSCWYEYCPGWQYPPVAVPYTQ